jgi:ABC-type multidrug transport system fused ATPase/permease subunit
MPRFLLHTIFLLLAAAGVFFWLESQLRPYTLQLVAGLVLLYLASHALRRKHPKWFNRGTVTIDITILTSMMLLLIAETGILASPFFFLLYFLLFAVSMLYEVEATLVLTGVLILFFLFIPGTNLTDIAHLTELLALIMVTPLAIFTGHQYEVSLEDKKARAELNKHLERTETDALMFLSLNLKSTLVSALDTLSIVIPVTKVKELRTNLETLYGDLKVLYRSAAELETTIDRESDK